MLADASGCKAGIFLTLDGQEPQNEKAAVL